jgi:hypothetical protein
MTLSTTMLCHYAECRVLFINMLILIMLSVVMLNVIMLSVAVPYIHDYAGNYTSRCHK